MGGARRIAFPVRHHQSAAGEPPIGYTERVVTTEIKVKAPWPFQWAVRPLYTEQRVGLWSPPRQYIVAEDAADLCGRLREHRKSIEQALNLASQDFVCRFIVLDGLERDLISPIEAALIRHHHPLWNVVIDGFGNHDPGSGRYRQARSDWDILHAGRP